MINGSESDKNLQTQIQKCTCDKVDCCGWTYQIVPFEDISKKIEVIHILTSPSAQIVSEDIAEYNAKLCKDMLYEYGKTINSYIARGIEDGYDMKSAIYDLILKIIQNELSGNNLDVRIYKENEDNGKLWKKIKISDRNSPSQYAFDMYDNINEDYNDDLIKLIPSRIFSIRFLPISLFEMEVQDKDFQKERFTAIILEIKCQILPTAIIVIKAE